MRIEDAHGGGVLSGAIQTMGWMGIFNIANYTPVNWKKKGKLERFRIPFTKAPNTSLYHVTKFSSDWHFAV